VNLLNNRWPTISLYSKKGCYTYEVQKLTS
jgi:hypothetical protein